MSSSKKQSSEAMRLLAVNAVLNDGLPVVQVAKTFNIHRANLYRWIEKYKSQQTLGRVNNPHSGRQPKLNAENIATLLSILKKPAIDYGYESDFWTTRRLSQVLKCTLKISISKVSVFRMLKKLNLSYKKPEPRFYEASPQMQHEWKTKTVLEIKSIIEKYNAILYFEDEANISLKPIMAKSWGPIGEKIIKKVTGNKGSVSAISAISSKGKLLFNVHDHGKRYAGKDIVRFLSQMLIYHPRRHLVVIMDQAPCHTSLLVKNYVLKQKRLHVFYLPPRSPEFNPDEKVWNHLKHQELKSHLAKTTDELKKITVKKLKKMARDKRVMMGIYHRSEGASFFK